MNDSTSYDPIFIEYGLSYKRENNKLIRKDSDYTKGVKIGDNIFFGYEVLVVRGTYRDTVIGSGVKIGNRVNVGHNVIIGDDTVISPNVILCGSCEIGNNCSIGAGSVIKEHIKIGNGCVIGGLRYVNKDMKDDSRF